MARFTRFPTAEVDSTAHDVTVVLREARYERVAQRGWGVITVRWETDPPR